MIAQKMMTAVRLCASVIASAPIAYASRPSTYARLRPMRSPTLLLIRMNAAETSASSAIADWTLLTVVSRSSTTAEIETFISDVSTTSTNIAIASSSESRLLVAPPSRPLELAPSLIRDPHSRQHGSELFTSSSRFRSSAPSRKADTSRTRRPQAVAGPLDGRVRRRLLHA